MRPANAFFFVVGFRDLLLACPVDIFDASGDADKGSGVITEHIRFVNCHARGAPERRPDEPAEVRSVHHQAWITDVSAGSTVEIVAEGPDNVRGLVVGDGWRDTWRHRLETQPFPLAVWLGHQRRDGYWRHGSIAALP